MRDPLLFSMFQGPPLKSKTKSDFIYKEKNPFDVALDANISNEVDRLMSEQDPHSNPLLSIAHMRKKFEMAILEDLNCGEIGKHIITAIAILRNEGNHYLSDTDQESLMLDIDELRKQVANLDLNELDGESLKTALTISDRSLAAILQVSTAKFIEERFLESLSMFSFLSTLASAEPDSWYRLGLVA